MRISFMHGYWIMYQRLRVTLKTLGVLIEVTLVALG